MTSEKENPLFTGGLLERATRFELATLTLARCQARSRIRSERNVCAGQTQFFVVDECRCLTPFQAQLLDCCWIPIGFLYLPLTICQRRAGRAGWQFAEDRVRDASMKATRSNLRTVRRPLRFSLTEFHQPKKPHEE